MSRRRRFGVAALAFVASVLVASAPVGAQTSSTSPGRAGTTTTTGRTTTNTTQNPEPKAWALVDADRGVVLGGRNLHTAYPTASTVKLVTALASAARLPFNASVTVSKLASDQPARKIGMAPGSVWTYGDLLHCLLMSSANDAAYAIAETIGSDLAGFAQVMTQTAQTLGMRDSTFNDPAGLDGTEGFNGGSQMSAFDLAVAARNVLATPELADIVKSRTYEFTGPDGGHNLLNHNATFLGSYKGANGMKTGFTKSAGRTLVASATRDGRSMIAVVLDTYDVSGWAAKLLDRGFAADPAAPGIDQPLPPVVSATAEGLNRSLAGLPPLLGRPILGVSGTSAAAASASAGGQPAGTTTAPTPAPSTPAKTASADDGPGLGTMLVMILLGLIAAVVVLRVRAVNRRRRRRAARLRAFNDARRRGAITVLDADQYAQPTHVQTVNSRR